MSISDKNIDQWLFNYYEGNLSPAEVRQLESFLKKNPEYYEDANAWKDSFVEESIPAFDTSMLVKDVSSKADRKRYALVSVLLLFLGTFSALYLTTTSTNGSGTSDKGVNSNRTSANTVVSHNTYNNSNTIQASHNMSNAVGSYTKMYDNTVSSNPVNTINSKPVYPSTNALTFNNVVSNRSMSYNNGTTNSPVHNQVINRVNSQVINNANPANTQVNNDINLQIYSNLNTFNSSPAVTNYQQSPYVAPIQNPTSINLVTNNANTVIESATVVVNPIGQNNEPGMINGSGNSVILLSSNTNTNNPLSLNDVKPFEVASNEMVESTTAANEDINLTLDDKTAVVVNNNNDKQVNTGLGPDGLPAKNTNDPLKTDEVISKDKKDIKVENGILFTNLKNVILLQGINSEFEQGSSFISQHFATDGFVGANYSRVSGTGETFQNILAGYSTTLRKSRTTFNGYGHFTNTNLYRNIGVGLQAAKSFKLDRYNFLIPSVGISFEQYSFNPQPLAWNCIPQYAPKTYYGSELTGKADYLKYKSANHINVSAGVLYHAKKYFVGVSFNGLAQPKFKYQGENTFNMRTATNTANVQLVAGTDFISQKYRELSLSPQLILEVRNMEPVATGGAVIRYKTWAVGAGVSTKGAINTYAGFNHRNIGIQYRFMFDKLDPSTYGNLSGHYLTTHINIQGLSRKPPKYLADEK